MKRQIRIIPDWQEDIDVDRLAEALLELLNNLSDDERSRLVADAQRLQQPTRGGVRRKGSAA